MPGIFWHLSSKVSFTKPSYNVSVRHFLSRIITSDNPRSEDPEAIISDIRKGIPKNSAGPEIIEILDRAEAIEKLVSLAEPGDAVFVLGKGHEDYQIIGDKKIPFDDRLVVQEALKRKSRVFS